MKLMLLSSVFLPMLLAFVCCFVGKKHPKLRNVLAIAATALSLLLAALLACCQTGEVALCGVCGLGLRFTLDGFRKVYCIVIAFMWTMTTTLSDEYLAHAVRTNRYYFFNLMTLGATMGVFLAADLFTALVFFEIMSFTSYTWVIQEETKGAIKAANTYLAVAVIGGLAALMGLFLLQHYLGTTEISQLYTLARACQDKTALYVAGGCILFGFGAKAGMFPLHIWLPKAHPVAPAPASALLSGILTKTGIFGILAISCNIFRYDPAWGTVILVLGTITMVLGAVLALFSIDMKRTLACSSMSQIGFILVGVGMMGLLGSENAFAARGTLLHMVNHSLFKLVLFMAAGVIFMNLHALDLNEIRGFGRKKPLLKLAFLLGGLGIGGIPLLNGYVSKTLLHESIVEYGSVLSASGSSLVGIKCVEWLFLLSGGLTLAYMTKLFVAIFVEKHPTKQAQYDKNRHYMNFGSAFALALSAALLPLLGLTANRSMNVIADVGTDFFHAGAVKEAVSYLSWGNLKGVCISIAIGAVVYVLVVRLWMRRKVNGNIIYVNRWPEKLDLEELFYRPLLLKWLPAVLGGIAALFGENKLTTPLCRGVLRFGKWLGALFGENRLTQPLALAFFRVCGVISRAFSDLTDAAVLLLRKTVYKDSPVHTHNGVTDSLSYRIGEDVDGLAVRYDKEKAGENRYAKLFFRAHKTAKDTGRRITGSFSFALLMLCAAICFVFIYILIIH